MNQKPYFTIFIPHILLWSIVLSNCAESRSLAPSLAPALSQTPSPTISNLPSATTAITATPAMDNKSIIITPDSLLSLPGLKAPNTPNSEDFCEHLPPPQVVANSNRLSLHAGRFALCIYEKINIAIDLDTGNFVSTDNEGADIAMGSVPWGSNEEPGYGLVGWNNAYINNAYVLETYANHSGVNNLSYEYCDNLLRGRTDPGAMTIEEGKIACVRTTENKIALIRVEKIYPPSTLGVEFSFVVLRDN